MEASQSGGSGLGLCFYFRQQQKLHQKLLEHGGAEQEQGIGGCIFDLVGQEAMANQEAPCRSFGRLFNRPKSLRQAPLTLKSLAQGCLT